MFQDVPGGLIKLAAKNHQYLGANNALEALADIWARQGKLGVFWHTQGSGKSVSMMFFAQKVLRKVPGNWTFAIVTDGQELDGQIDKHFASAGVVAERNKDLPVAHGTLVGQRGQHLPTFPRTR